MENLKYLLFKGSVILIILISILCLKEKLASQDMQVHTNEIQPQHAFVNCQDYYFESIGDLPGDCISSLPTDISGDGLRVVLMSSADEPDVPNDGGACDPWLGWPHSNEAAGWTRPCKNIPFFTPPQSGSGGLTGFGYLLNANPSHHESIARGISPDGDIVVGYSNYKQDNNAKAVVFRKDEVLELALLDSGCMANDICMKTNIPSFQADTDMNGRIIVGYSNVLNQYAIRYPGAKAVYWDDWNHIVALPMPADSILPNGAMIFSSEAVSISDDGKIIAGNIYYDQLYSPQHHMSFPCVWVYQGTGRNGSLYDLLCVLEDLPGGDDCASVDQVSGNGLVLVGTGSRSVANPACWNYPVQACKWTLSAKDPELATCSGPQALPNLDGFPSSGANGVNYSGSVIVGSAYLVTGPCLGETFTDSPLIWNGNDPDQPPVNLTSIFSSMIPEGWTLYEAVRVSADGRTITGYAIDSDWNVQGWVAGLQADSVPLSSWSVLIGISLILIYAVYKSLNRAMRIL